MQKVEVQYDLDISAFMERMEKAGQVFVAFDEKIRQSSKQNPLAGLTQKTQEYNRALGQQAQIYLRVQAAETSLRQEQKRLEAQYVDLKKRQLEFLAAGRYGELKTQLGLIRDKLREMNSPLVETNSLWDKLKAKVAAGLPLPKIKPLPKPPGADQDNDSGAAIPKGSGRLRGAVGSAADELAGVAGVSLTAAGAVAAAGVTIVKSTKEWAEYGKKLSEVSAITGATGKSLQFLDDQAQQIEADTGIAGTAILDAFKNIGSIKPEILENSELLAQTTKEVIALSQAANIDLTSAAKAVLGSLNQFGEGADQAGRYVNVLAAGALKGASEINETADALQNSGTAMKAAGLSFEQGNALVQSLAKVMIRGAEAGTGLRNVLLKLETSADKNLRPSVVGLDAALENASKKFNTTTELTKAFGVENIVAARQVIENRAEIAKMTKEITGTSVAYEQARKQTDNLATDLTKSGTAISRFFRSLGESQDGFLRTSIQSFTAFLNSLSSKTGVMRALLSEAFSFKGITDPIGAYTRGVAKAYQQRQANTQAEARKAEYDGIVKGASQSVTDDTKRLQAEYEQQGVAVPKAQRQAAAEQKRVRDAEYVAARADHNRIRKEYERAGTDQKDYYDKQFAQSRRKILAAQTAQKQASAEVARLEKADNERAAALASALSEPVSTKNSAKAQKAEQDQNKLLLDAQKDYQQELEKLEAEFGKERLDNLDKDSAEYINARARLDQDESEAKRQHLEKLLQLQSSHQTRINKQTNQREIIPNTSVTLERNAPDIAQAFAQQQQQIERERVRQLSISRVKQEYDILELAKKSDENDLALFDKQWEAKILSETENGQKYLALVKQRDDARALIQSSSSKEELDAFDDAWKRLLEADKLNYEKYKATIAKRDRDRNVLVTDQLLDRTRKQEGIELDFVDTNQFEKDLRTDDPSLNADDIFEKRERKKIEIRIRTNQELLKLLKEQGAAENAALITLTQVALDALEKQQQQLVNNSPKFRDVYDLLGITDGMNQTQLDAFRQGLVQIGQSIQQVAGLIVESSQQRIQALDAEIQAKQQQVSIEEERSKEGYANNLALRKAELEDLKRQKAQEEATRRKALAVQQSIDLASQVSNAAVTISEGIRFLTSYASRSATLGPIAGPIAYFATIASILASIVAVRQQFKAITKLRKGGRVPLNGRTHEQQHGHRIEGTDIYVERGEHVTNAKSSEKYDDALTYLNQDNPQKAFQSLAKQFGYGLPEVVIKHIQSPAFGRPAPQLDTTKLEKQVAALTEETREMRRHIAELPKSQMVGLGDGRVIEKNGHQTTITDHGKK